MPVTIRKCKHADMDGVIKVYRECFGDDYNDDEEIEEHSLGYPVAKDGTRVVGFLACERNPHPYIWGLGVSQDMRKQGIASRLLKGFEAQCDGAARLWLHVNVDNPAQKLYFDHGYRVVSVEEDYYEEQVHGLVMVKKLM